MGQKFSQQVPWAQPGELPEFGALRQVAEDILWLRLPLPYQLDHVNIYLLREGAGWAAVDVGIYDERTIAMWQSLLAGPLKGTPLTRQVITHHHPDHMGMAGWLAQTHDVPVLMTRTEYLMGKYLGSGPQAISGDFQLAHYERHGASVEEAGVVVQRGHNYLSRISGLPDVYFPLEAGDRLELGGRQFEVLTGGGHSPDQAMLWAAADDLFLPADQVLERISPNVSVFAAEPLADPLGMFLGSLAALSDQISDTALTLPGHRGPLRDPKRRIAELAAHHEERCQQILALLGTGSATVRMLSPQLFPRIKDPHQLSFAFSETLAHVNYMVRTGRLTREEEAGVIRFRAM